MNVGEPDRALDGRMAQQCIARAQSELGGRAIFACNFGAEDMVILDLIARTAA